MSVIEINICVDGLVMAYIGIDGVVLGDTTLAQFVADHESQPEGYSGGRLSVDLALRDDPSSPGRPLQSPEMLLFGGESNAADRWRVASLACRRQLRRPPYAP